MDEKDVGSKLRCDECNKTLATIGLYVEPRASIKVLCKDCYDNQRWEYQERQL